MNSETRPGIDMLAALCLLVALAAAFFRTGLLTAPAEFDEFYHLLAARSWSEGAGGPAILDGNYDRAWLFTGAVALLYDVTGIDTLFVGRLASMVLSVLLPVAALIWLTAAANVRVGLVAAFFLIFWPRGLLDAQLLRFYSAHALFFGIGAMAFYMIWSTQGAVRWAMAALTLGAWALSFHFQIATVFGVLAALGWLCFVLIVENLPGWRARGLAAAALFGLGAVAIGAMAATGLLEKAWAIYRWTPQHSAAMADYHAFYANQLERHYSWLLYATPLLALLALWARPRLTSYALMIFGLTFVIHSFGGMKALRYISYSTPFLFVVWAIAFVDGIARLVRVVAREPAGGDLRVATAMSTLAALAVTVAATGFVPRSFELLRGQGVLDRGDWSGMEAVTGDWQDAGFVAATRELHYLAFAEADLDMIVSSSRVSELAPPEEFGTDPRIGRPALGTEASMEAVLACHRDGLLVAGPEWTDEMPWAAEFAGELEEAGLDYERREAGAIIAWRWTDPEGAAPDCAGLP